MRAPRVDLESSSSSSEAESWAFVPVRRGNIIRRNHENAKDTEEASDNIDIDELREAVTKTLQTLTPLLEREGFFDRYDSYWEGATVVAAYGVGSISNSSLARFQLALMLAIVQRSKISQCFFFDPVLSKTEIRLLESLHVKSALRDLELTPFCDNGKTLFFMPHCDRELYEWVLMHKLSPNSDAVFVSNCFSNYALKSPTWELIVPFFDEELLLLYSSDYQKYLLRKNRFAARAAEKSGQVPFGAFNDLGFIRVHRGRQDFITQALVRMEQNCS